MIEDVKKSVQSILSQRLYSPFYGTLIISWSIWNWKIIYLTLFVSESKIEELKIDYIINHFSDYHDLILYPLLSTLLLLTILPFFTNAAYWADLIFDAWRANKKNKIEKNQLLTLQQSILLREQITTMEKRFETMLSSKNDEIKMLNTVLTDMKTNERKESERATEVADFTAMEIEKLANNIKENQGKMVAHSILNRFIVNQSGLSFGNQFTLELLGFFEANELVERKPNGTYEWTTKGKKVNRMLF